jgi:hypothetical protein
VGGVIGSEKDETMHFTMHFRCVAALLLWLGATLPCAAQNTPAPLTSDPACSAGRTVPPRAGPGNQSLSERLEQTNQSLSERLEQTDGVICPPDIDPDIKAPTPQAGRTPVIPPPGSPGGDPTVRPK